MSNNKDFKVKNGIQPAAYHEGLGTVVSSSEYYSLAGFSYDNKSFSVAAQETNPSGLFISTDGTSMYVCGSTGDDVNQYSLSTPWDISTASYVRVRSVSANILNPQGVYFSSDGTRMYVFGLNPATSNDYLLAQYSLSTPWNISTTTYVRNFAVSSAAEGGRAFYFKDDGTKLYIVTNGNNRLNEYTLSTAWDISTTSFVQFASFIANGPVFIDSTGEVLFIVRNSDVYKYTLSTPWDISTATYANEVVDASNAFSGIHVKSDGTKLYYVESGTDSVYQNSIVLYTQTLDLSTGSVFEITPTSDIQVTLSNPAASGTVSGATLLLEVGATPYTITYDTNIEWPAGTAPTAPAANETDVITFTTRDGGTTYNAALAIDGAS